MEANEQATSWPFSSKRERRLWLLAFIVQLGIFSSLGPARTVVELLRERGLLQVSVTIAVLAVLVPLAWQWLKSRPGWSEIGVALGIAFVYWLTFIRIENPAERTHLIEYGVLAALIHMALLERESHGRRLPMSAAFAMAATALLGLLDEGIQYVLPNRVFDWIDVFFNAFAGFMVIVARLALAPVRLPGWRLWFLWLLAAAVGWGWSLDPGTFGAGGTLEVLPAVFTLTLPRFPGVAVGAVTVGTLHWLILRRYFPRAIRWALASLASATVAALMLWFSNLIQPNAGVILAVTLHGSVAGLMQWLVLRQQVGRAGWWVLFSTIGWLTAIALADFVGPPGWAAFGAVTGTLLIGLLRQKADG